MCPLTGRIISSTDHDGGKKSDMLEGKPEGGRISDSSVLTFMLLVFANDPSFPYAGVSNYNPWLNGRTSSLGKPPVPYSHAHTTWWGHNRGFVVRISGSSRVYIREGPIRRRNVDRFVRLSNRGFFSSLTSTTLYTSINILRVNISNSVVKVSEFLVSLIHTL